MSDIPYNNYSTDELNAKHDIIVEHIGRTIKDHLSSDNQIVIKRSSTKNETCCLRAKNFKDGKITVDVSELTNVLEYDKFAKTLTIEPGVTMETILQTTINDNLMVPCITEFRNMTMGGALMGLGGESTSFKHGLIHDANVLEYQVVDGHGHNHVASPTINTELFNNISGSYGNFGIITRIKLRLIEASSHVKMEFHHFSNVVELNAFFKRGKKRYDFMEGVMTQDNKFVTICGTFSIQN